MPASDSDSAAPPRSIETQVVACYDDLFARLFARPFGRAIDQPLRRRAVRRRIESLADGAAQALIRLLVHQRVDPTAARTFLAALDPAIRLIRRADVADPTALPGVVADRLTARAPCPQEIDAAGQRALYRVALLTLVDSLAVIGPVLAEWHRAGFGDTFEPIRALGGLLERANACMDAIGDAARGALDAADERYELLYRDHVIQRFHRVDAGTVSMATRLDVDVRELFVMPQVRERSAVWPSRAGSARPAPTPGPSPKTAGGGEKAIGERTDASVSGEVDAIEFVRRHPRLAVIGPPGSGKSTFVEWLQVTVAGVDHVLVAGDRQAIPLLLRARQLDPRDLPRGRDLVAHAAASADRARLMPDGWIERQLAAGRVLVIVDGLDEIEPAARDAQVLPWLIDMVERYPDCRYVVTSRPGDRESEGVGTVDDVMVDHMAVDSAPADVATRPFTRLGFVECSLLAFDRHRSAAYARRWSTAVRVARGAPATEARREGELAGDAVVANLRAHPAIRDLARNPLMLSAICLVSDLEGGRLPEDRARLFELCVDGLLHHWDARRGIASGFTLGDKLRACREIALAMQVANRAEITVEAAMAVIAVVVPAEGRRAAVSDPDHVIDTSSGMREPAAAALLDHLRRRSGLLVEPRPGVLAFAHLAFQAYLAAVAVLDGNRLSIDVEMLVRAHGDERWRDVLPLCCGAAGEARARGLVERCLAEPATPRLGTVTADVWLAAPTAIRADNRLRRRMIERVAALPGAGALDRLPADDVATVANTMVSSADTAAFWWLLEHPEQIDSPFLIDRLRSIPPNDRSGLVFLVHRFAGDGALKQLAGEPGILATDADARLALAALDLRRRDDEREGPGAAAARAAAATLLKSNT